MFRNPRVWTATLVTLVLGSLVVLKLLGEGYSGLPLVAGLFPLFCIGWLFFLVAFADPVQGIQKFTAPAPWRILLLPAGLTTLWLIYAVGTDGFALNKLTIFIGYVFVPTLCLLMAGRDSRPGPWDFIFLMVLWIPVDAGWLQSVWDWPAGAGRNVYSIPMACALALILILTFRRIPDPQFRFRLRRSDLKPVLFNLGLFLAIGIPAGLLTGFIAWNPKPWDPAGLLLSCLLTFLLVAAPEELFFRGIMQGYVTKILGKPRFSLILVSLIFGLAHLNNTDPYFDWRYIILASIAGFLYGLTYEKTNNLTPAMLVHTGVDVIWINFFYIN